MQAEEYTFVTIDDADSLITDAVVIDMDNDDDMLEFVVVNDGMDTPDFITLSNDTIMLSDSDTIDTYSSEMNDMDISVMI